MKACAARTGARRRAFRSLEIFILAFLIAAIHGNEAQSHELNVEFMSANGKECRLTVSVTKEGGKKQTAVTRFQADRLDSQGHYIHGVEEGGIDGLSIAGTYIMEEDVVEQDGTYRQAESGDPKEKIRRITKTFSISPRGHCTFFHGVVHVPGSNDVERHYMWGYPLGTVKEVPSKETEPRSGDL